MGVTDSIDLKPADRKLLLRLLEKFLPDTEIWAFGSRVKWTAGPHSDLDLIAFTLDKKSVSNLKESFEESGLTIQVDLHLWSELPEKFKTNIKESYTIIKKRDGGNL